MKFKTLMVALSVGIWATSSNAFTAEVADFTFGGEDRLASSSAGEIPRPNERGSYNYHLDNNLVSKIQQELKERGYEVNTDGRYDSKTKQALRQFQNTAGISQRSGTIDAETLKALKISTEAPEEGLYSE